MRSHFSLGRYGGLALLLIIYLPLALAYSAAIPFSKGPDEYINYQYILFIAKHHRLPATLAERREAGVKADWQPLYHLAGGAAAAFVPLTSPPELKVTWEPATRQLIDLVLPRATLVRTEDERPPYRGVYAVWQVGRWVSLILGVGTLVVTYLLGLTLWPGQPALAMAVTALLIFSPRFLFTHAVLSDDTMLGFCLALYLLLLARLVTTVSFSPWLFIGLGVSVGLAVVTKYTAIPAVVGVLIIGAWIAHRQKWPWPVLLQRGALFAGSLVLAAGWWVGWTWWHFNQVDNLGPIMGLLQPLLPGAVVDDNPTTARLTALLSGQSVADLGEAAGAGGNFFDWAWHSFITFWGVTVFGAEPSWPYPYNFILAGLALFCVVAALGLWRVYRSDRLIWSAFALHSLLFLPLPLLRFALSGRLNDAAQGRHLLFPAGPALMVLLMAGWLAWFQPRWRNRMALLAGGLMLAWGSGHWFYLWPAYPPPLPVRTTPGPQMQVAQSIQINFGDTPRLAGYQTQLAGDGAVLQIDLVWQSLAQAWEDYRTEITLVDDQGQPQLRWLSHPTDGRFPVRAWQPGDTVRDTLYIPLAGLSPADYQVQLRLLGWTEPLASELGETLTLTTLTLDAAIPLSEPALWQQGEMVAQGLPTSSPPFGLSLRTKPRLLASSPTYRYRSTIPVTVAEPVSISLVDPAGQAHPPLAEIGTLRVFIVDYDWPSGDYRLQVAGQDSGLKLRVENFSWNFTPPEMMVPVEANFAGKIELLGYDLPTRRTEAGSGLPLVLYWRGLTQMREDYTIFVQLLDANLQRRGGYDRFPRENYNTYLWVPGEVVDDGFAVPVDANAPNGVYSVRVGWYHRENGQAVSLPLVQAGQTLNETSVVIGPIKVGGPSADIVAAEISPEHGLAVNLGDVIRLSGYDLKVAKAAISLKLYWQSLARTELAYTVFVHLRNEAGQTIAQVDGPPAAGQYPTLLWDAGEVIPDEFTLNLPPELTPGAYHLVVGLYDPATGARLSVPGTADNSVFLTEMELN